MDISLVGSKLVATGAGQATSGPASSIVSPVTGSSQSNVAVNTPAPSSSQLTQAVKQVNDAFSQRNQNIFATIGKDEATGIEVVKFVDQATKETISQYPSKAILAIAQSLQNSPDSGGQLINIVA